ncbi:MAG: extracellular solute-binding protein [Fervidicoccaceae archaeon]
MNTKQWLFILLIIAMIGASIAVSFMSKGSPSQNTSTVSQTAPLNQTTVANTTQSSASSTTTTTATQQTVELYVSHWGFSWNIINETVIKPFEQKYNVKVVLISGTTADRYSKLVAGSQPVPDLIFLPDYYAYMAAQKGLLEELNFSKIGNYNQLAPFIKESFSNSALSKYAVPHTIQDLIIIYRGDRHAPISSIKDIWRGDFNGTIYLPDITTTSGPMFLILTSIAYGGNLSYMDPAFNVIKSNRASIATFYTSSAALTSALERGEAEVAVGLRYQLGAIQGLNKTMQGSLLYTVPSEGSVFEFNVMAIPKNAAHKDLAYALMDFWLSTEIQQKLAERGVDAPVNVNVSLPPDNYFNYMSQIKKPIYVLPEVLSANLQSWISKWKEQIAG